MESTFSILINWFKDFVGGNKGHMLSLGVGSVIVGICIAITAHTSGLHGELTYLALHPGTTGPVIGGGILLVIASMMFGPPEES